MLEASLCLFCNDTFISSLHKLVFECKILEMNTKIAISTTKRPSFRYWEVTQGLFKAGKVKSLKLITAPCFSENSFRCFPIPI